VAEATAIAPDQDGYRTDRGDPRDDFIACGELTLFNDGKGDVAAFQEVVGTAAATGKLGLIGIDACGATELTAAFVDFGVEVASVPQGRKLTPAITWIERRLTDDAFRHNGTKLMRWNIGNTVITGQGNVVSISKATAVGAGKI
jgi:phage terminase large subunit-like protein